MMLNKYLYDLLLYLFMQMYKPSLIGKIPINRYFVNKEGWF